MKIIISLNYFTYYSEIIEGKKLHAFWSNKTFVEEIYILYNFKGYSEKIRFILRFPIVDIIFKHY